MLNGKAEGLAQQETVLPLAALALRLYTTTEAYPAAPDSAQRRLTAGAQDDVRQLYRDLARLVGDGLPRLKAATDAAGVAWPAAALPQMPAGDLVPAQP